MLQEKNLIIPIQLTKIIYSSWKADLAISNSPNQIYGKALHGKGEVAFKNGNLYLGFFHNGMLHGQGKFTWANGTVYEGQFKYNRIDGVGKYVWADGSSYEGQVRDGLRQGSGVYTAAKNEHVYRGEWKNGLRQGQGRIQFQNGTVYQGSFKNGLKEGKGKITFPSNNYYEGDWKNDVKEGHGVMNWLTKNQKYVGEWKNDQQNGQGWLLWLQPRGENKQMRNRYQGQWLNGCRHGLGTFFYANGAQYQGEWCQNIKEGTAFFFEDNGQLLQGTFRQDRLSKGEEDPRKGSVMSSKQQSKEKSKKQIDLQANPYASIVDISDITIGAPNSQLLNNLLLRNNSQLKTVYRFFCSKYDQGGQFFFCLNLDGFWKILKEMKLLGGHMSLASFNRSFFSGANNHYADSNDLQKLSLKINVAKSRKLTKKDLTIINYHSIALSYQKNKECQELCETKEQVHRGSKLLLFRHFAESLVRVGELKYGKGELNKSLEKVLNKIIPNIQSQIKQEKKQTNSSVDNVSSFSHNLKRDTPLFFRSLNEDLFKRVARKANLAFIQDYSITVFQVLKLLEENKLISDQIQRQLLIHKLQKQMDNDFTSTDADQSKKKKKVNQGAHLSQSQKASRYRALLQFQLIFSQFNDVLYYVIQRKIQASNSQERRAKYQEIVNKMIGNLKKPIKKYQFPLARKSKKDVLKEELIARRNLEIQTIRQQTLKREEYERELQQLLMMSNEDFDIEVEEEQENSVDSFD